MLYEFMGTKKEMRKVYCYSCKHFWYEMLGGNDGCIPRCFAEDNMRVYGFKSAIHYPVKCREPKRSPRRINRRNNCQWFEDKGNSEPRYRY